MSRATFAVLLGALLTAAWTVPAVGEPGGPAFSAGKRQIPHVRVTVQHSDRATLARTRAMRVKIRSRGPGTVRISTTHAAAEGERRPRVRTAKRKVVRFKRRGTKQRRLVLTGAGRQLIDACRRARVRVAVRVLAPHSRRARRSSHTKHGMRTLNFESALCPDSDVRGDTRDPGGGGNGPGGGPGGPPTPTSIKAGAGASDLTPPIGTPMFAYTARSRLVPDPDDPFRAAQIVADPDENLYAKSFEPSEGIHTRVLARALVLEQGGEKFALVHADLGGVPFALTQEVAKRTGFKGENIMLAATHTHASTGPIWPADNTGYAALGGDLFDPRIWELTAQGITEAVKKGEANLEPARVAVGYAEERNASRNREYEPYLENPEVQGLSPEEQRANSIDPLVTVVRADAAGGGPIGVWSNFAIHPTSLGDDNLLFSGDNAATSERMAEREIVSDAGRQGLAPPPDKPMVNVWTNSNEGDISPNGGPDNPDGEPLQYVLSQYASANLAGARVANGIVRAWRDAGERLSGDIPIGARRTLFAFDGTPAGDGRQRPVGPNPVLGGGIVSEGLCSPVEDAAGPGQGHKFPGLQGAGLVPQHTPVGLWRFGSTGIVTFPTEITKTMGQRMRGSLAERSGGQLERVILSGLTNGYHSYNSTPEEYEKCTYEGSFTLFGIQQGARYRDVASLLVNPLLAGGPAPQLFPEPPPPAFGAPPAPKARTTPEAGTVVEEPAETVRRMGMATFKWEGGDPNIDAPRNETFVSLQRRIAGDWVTVGTDDGYFDNTHYNRDDDVWTETWQFTECDPLDTYRFVATGYANKGQGRERYTAVSRAFELRPTPIEIIDAVVDGETARVRARYAAPPDGALVALPRRVRHGSATFRAGGQQYTAQPDGSGLAYTATVPAGSSIEDVRVADACGNSGP